MNRNFNNKISLVILEKEEQNIKKIVTLLRNIPKLEIAEVSGNLDLFELILQEKSSNIVLLGPSYKLEDIEKILIANFDGLRFVKVILSVDKFSTDILKKAIKLNIHDVIEFPFIYDELRDSIKRTENMFLKSMEKPSIQIKEEEQRKKIHKKISVFSTKGGSGKSFIAVNLAVDLAKFDKKRVVLFDLDYQFGDVALMLNLYPKHTTYDIMSVINQLDSEMLNSFLTIHESGVKVLPAPIDPSQEESISIAATMKILDIFSDISDYVIIDTPSGFSDNVMLLLEKTDFLCIVASKDVPNIKNLKISLQILKQLKFPEEKIFVILNRADSKVGITIDEIEKTIKQRINVTIPSDKLVPLCINKGIPVVVRAPRSMVSKSIRKLTRLLLEAG
ncbi:MAG: P-loop NTPase [Actinobacteria bacterium]|nr:P-loop NTPase [Actinomycetota bacterium]